MKIKRPLGILFLGISSRGSLIHKVVKDFVGPWGLHVAITCCDLPMSTDAKVYREVLLTLEQDAGISGAVVTAHKVALYRAAHDLLIEVSPQCRALEEIGALKRSNRGLIGHATDEAALRRSLTSILEPSHGISRDVLVLGCGGAGLALVSVLSETTFALQVRSITVFEKKASRRAELHRLFAQNGCLWKIRLLSSCDINSAIEQSAENALIVNATGLGKETGDCPVGDIIFPRHSIAWDFNYRGPLPFLE